MTTNLYVVSDGGSAHGRSAVKVSSQAAARKAYAGKHALWLAYDASDLRVITKAVHICKRGHALLTMETISPARRVLMDAFFSVVVEPSPGMALLPWEELREVVASKDARDLFVAAQALPDDDMLVLVRGDLGSLVVPLSTFRQAKGGPKPDAARVSVTDYGQTVCFGEYEVAADALLYECDADARRRLKKRAIQADATLGGAIRRLRSQKGIAREDFGSTSAKTLARIERGETQPRSRTLSVIARRLGVPLEELSAY